MRTRHRRSRARIAAGMLLSLLVVLPASRPWLAKVVTNALAEGVPEAGEASLSQTGCGMSKNDASLALVPELLALADWPLDKPAAGPCANLAVAAAETPPADELPPPVEIRVLRVKKVYAAGYEPADSAGGAARPSFPRLAAVDPTALDDIRGGFEVPDSNLRFSFGIERVVYLNGQMVASTVLNLKDLQSAAGGTASPADVAAGMNTALGVIQNGAGNSFSVQGGQGAKGTVIQNTLNNQQINTVTTINAAVNSARVLRSIDLQSAIQTGVVNSLRR